MVEIQGFMASLQLGTSQKTERMQIPDSGARNIIIVFVKEFLFPSQEMPTIPLGITASLKKLIETVCFRNRTEFS